MFTILVKDFAGRKWNRYFCDWNNAKAAMEQNIKDTCESLNGVVHTSKEFMDEDKGFYVCYTTAGFPNGENCTWSLVEGYFEDEPNK